MPVELEELYRIAEEAGYEVSEHQLERWRRRGLLPRPERKGLGRGRGTMSLYPDYTPVQLRLLLLLKERHRKLDKIGSRLWCAGFPVLRWVRPFLIKTFKLWDEKHGGAVDKLLSGDPDNFISRSTDIRLPRYLADRRRAVGNRRFPTAARAYVEILAGRFVGDWMTEEDDDFEILDAMASRSKGEPSDTKKEIMLAAGQALSRFFEPDQHIRAAQEVSDRELLRVRDEAFRFNLTLAQHVVGEPRRLPWQGFRLWFMVRLGCEEANQLWKRIKGSDDFEEYKKEFWSQFEDE